MRVGKVHIIGAGLAGLSAAVELASAGAEVIIHEAAGHAGGRCRSYHDPRLQMEIDNGNHLLLSSNAYALRYLRSINALDRVTHLPDAHFPFVDNTSMARWTIAPSAGPLPLWLLSPGRRAPDARLRDYMGILRLLWTAGDQPVSQIMACEGPLYRNLVRPLLLAALNTEPAEASSALARQLMRDTLLKGAQACKPIIATQGLSRAFVDPALALLKKRRARSRFATRLRDITITQDRATDLRFEDHTIPLGPQDSVILATPPQMAARLAPGVTTPDRFNAILNIHFAIQPPLALFPITGMVGGVSEWLFAYPDRLSVTISDASHLFERRMEDVAADVWREVAMIARITTAMPPWRMLREKRATFAATPEQNRKRPGARTGCSNLFLAGDWTATGLPATIEGAIKSGVTAARQAQALFPNEALLAHADRG